MKENIAIRHYQATDKEDCLSLFDLNCPTFFAPNERQDYAEFLDKEPHGYLICTKASDIVGVFGLCQSTDDSSQHSQWNINWIMINPNAHGHGIGRIMMKEAIRRAQENNIPEINIAASHLSAQFFEKFGAFVLAEIPDGWGPGMHRVDMKLTVS